MGERGRITEQKGDRGRAVQVTSLSKQDGMFPAQGTDSSE